MAFVINFVSDRAESADLKVLIADSSLHPNFLVHPTDSPTDYSNLQSLSKRLLCHGDGSNTQGLSDLAAKVFDRDGTIIVMNKTDLLPPELTDRHMEVEKVPICWMSCKTGNGVNEFMDRMKQLLEQM